MLAGQDRETMEALERWSPAGEQRDRVGIIRSVILEFVLRKVRIYRQDRCATGLDEHVARVAAVLGDGVDVEPKLMGLLTQDDALSPVIWKTRILPDDLDSTFLPA